MRPINQSSTGSQLAVLFASLAAGNKKIKEKKMLKGGLREREKKMVTTGG